MFFKERNTAKGLDGQEIAEGHDNLRLEGHNAYKKRRRKILE